MKKIFLLLVIFPLFSPTILYAQAELTPLYIPVHEKLDLAQNGSVASPYIANLTEDFSIVVSIAFILHFTSNSYNIEDFGADSPLTNGLFVKYAGNTIINDDNITSNDDLQHHADYWTEFVDTANPKVTQFRSEIEFLFPLVISSQFSIQFYIQDDITALTTINEFSVHIKGYEIVQLETPDQGTKFDLLDTLEGVWTEINSPVIIFLLLLLGGLLTWVAFKKLHR